MIKQKKLETEKKVMQFFSSLADLTRLHILISMSHGSKTVNEIYDFVGREKMTLSAISHQLKQLSDMNIVKSEKKGKEKYYQLSDDFCWCILRDAFKQFGNDIEIRCDKCNKK